jgi:hypothetical protein
MFAKKSDRPSGVNSHCRECNNIRQQTDQLEDTIMENLAKGEKIVYKVVREEGTVYRDKTILTSCFAPINYLVKYEVGKCSKPRKKSTKLFAFGRVDFAKKFMRSISGSELSIYKCVATNVVPHKEIKSVRIANGTHCCDDNELYDHIWGLIKKWLSGERRLDWGIGEADIPAGTVLCDSITLLEKIA